MTTEKPECIVADCPAQHRRCGCGYLVAGTRCNHPYQRAEWEREDQKHEQISTSDHHE